MVGSLGRAENNTRITGAKGGKGSLYNTHYSPPKEPFCYTQGLRHRGPYGRGNDDFYLNEITVDNHHHHHHHNNRKRKKKKGGYFNRPGPTPAPPLPIVPPFFAPQPSPSPRPRPVFPPPLLPRPQPQPLPQPQTPFADPPIFPTGPGPETPFFDEEEDIFALQVEKSLDRIREMLRDNREAIEAEAFKAGIRQIREGDLSEISVNNVDQVQVQFYSLNFQP